ncbi:MAG: ATP-binding cassette domain-containing protein [Treponema sp.]|nr:ATP-binding cassette domain-containing protein [Treponema sp.]
MTYALELRDITTIYPADHFMANRNVSLSLRTGEILCLAGENGAGKTSLMKVLSGFIQPAQGEIVVKGNPVSITSPLGAARLGIGMVHQHFMLFPDFSVAENVVMGLEPVKFGFLYDFKTAVERVNALIKAHEFSIKADDRVSGLSVGQLQQVEIVKLLYRNADILILDEPSAALTEQETVSLFQTLRLLAKGGKSLILITHKLSEIKRISDRVAVMHKGELVALRETARVDEYEISQLMLGRDINETPQTMSQEDPPRHAVPVLSFNKVTVKRRRQEQPLLNELSFTAHSGEILAFAGAGNSGLEELEAVLGGLLPINSGLISHKGIDISHLNAESLRKRNLAYVPADRLNVGSEAQALISENIMIVRRRELTRHGILDRAAISRFCHTLFERFAIRGNESLRIGSLSGGNIQKLVLAREIDLLERGGDYIVFSKPTWGLDVAASNAVYERMTELRQKGVAILLLSSNLDEIIAMADRVLVLYRGGIVAELDTRPLDASLRELIGAYMLGLRRDESAQVVGASSETCAALRHETREPPPRDLRLSATRRRSFRHKTRESPPRRISSRPRRWTSLWPLGRLGGMALIVLAALMALVIFAFLFSETPLRTLRYFFMGPIQNTYYFGNMLNSAIPLIFGGLGASIAMRSNNLNLGGEGQVYIGGFVSTIAALALAPLGIGGAVLALLAGAIAAGLVSGASGFLKTKWDTSELITTFLLSNALLLIIDYLITGPFLDSETSLQSTTKIAQWFHLPKILPPSSLSAALFFAIAAVILVYLFLYHTLMGYEMRISGLNGTFARYGGVNTAKSGVLAMFLSGALYGIGGSMAIYGTYYATIKGFSAGMGWNGLAVALIARSRPQAIIPAALFFAWIESGAYLAMQFSDVTIELASITQSVVFFMASSAVLRTILTPRSN